MSKRASLDKREKETPKVIKGVMSAFVSSSNDDINKNDTKNTPKKVLDKSLETKEKSNTNSTENVKESETIINTNIVKDNKTKINTKNITNNETNKYTENVKDNETKINTENITNNETNNKTERVTNDVTKTVANKIPKITHVKSIRIGNRTLESTYSTEESTTRCAYHLRKDTIDKIEVCSKLSGLKKAEFVDLVLNSVLTEILNKGNKR